MPANGRCGSPWVMNDDAGSRSRHRCIEQCPIAEIKASQPFAAQMPTGAGALVSTLTRPGGIALIPKPDLCCLVLAVGRGTFEILIEKIQQKLVGFWPPLQMGGWADVKFWIAAPGSGRIEKVEETSQMGIPPAADQQHGFAEPGFWWAMESPAFGLICRLFQPAQGHSLGVMSLQEPFSFAEIATIDQSAVDLVPDDWIVAALGLQGCKLQAPAKAEVPPVSASFATPMLPFIQAAHGWCEAIWSWAVRWCKQLS